MNDAEKLSLAYQLMSQAPATYPDIVTALAQVELDAALVAPPAPLPGDVVGERHAKAPDGSTIEHIQKLGDGTELAVVA